MNESHIEHAIRLVQDKEFHMGDVDMSLID